MLTKKLQTLHDAQTEYVLIIYLLRTINPEPYLNLWSNFDHIMRDALSCIMAGAVTEEVWCQAKLPLTMGGLGLRSAVDHAPTAYVSSYNQSFVTVKDILGNPSLQRVPLPEPENQFEEPTST